MSIKEPGTVIMKLKGKKISTLFEKVLALPRADRFDPETGKFQEDIILKFRPINSWDQFNEVCKAPKPPMITFPGQEPRPCTPDEDDDYRQALQTYAQNQTRWMVIVSLTSGTPDLVFETVDMQKPETWANFEKELLESGFSLFEINEIYKTATEANVLTEDALSEAKKRFLASEEQARYKSLSPLAAQVSTQSGVLAKGSS